MILSPHLRRSTRRSQQDGYVLIVMLLFLTLLAISLTAVAPAMVQRIRRERELELIHRGKQYQRAIRLYYRKFGRFPVRLEELENTNRMRFLRRRYKDPMTESGTWRLIHFGEAQLTLPNASLLPGATAPGATATTGGGASFGVAGMGASSAFANTFASSSQSAQSTPQPAQANTAQAQTGTTQGGTSSDPSQSGQSSGQPGQPGTPVSQLSSPLGGGQTFGGGPVVGVSSTSKKESIRTLNNKNHYNDWEFVYDPRLDVNTLQAMPGLTNQPNPTAPGAQISTGGLQPGATPSPGMQTIMQPTNPTH